MAAWTIGEQAKRPCDGSVFIGLPRPGAPTIDSCFAIIHVACRAPAHRNDRAPRPPPAPTGLTARRTLLRDAVPLLGDALAFERRPLDVLIEGDRIAAIEP